MCLNKPIGGYFELESNNLGSIYHDKAIAVNSARNALEYILLLNDYKKIFIPYYTCDVILQPLKRLNINFEFYHLDNNFFPILDSYLENEVILYVNYFGLMNTIIDSLKEKFNNLIVDNAQAFFTRPLKGVSTFYSPRKFFGIPDGGFLYTTENMKIEDIQQDVSFNRCSHLLKRIDLSPEEGYKDFLQNDAKLDSLPICKMSRLTTSLLSQIDYYVVEKVRKENFNYLHKKLKKFNELNIELSSDAVPMVYPLLISNGKDLKKKLINYRIFVATYWPDVLERVSKDSFEAYLVNNLIPIPIDQRYGKTEMDFILEKIKLYE